MTLLVSLGTPHQTLTFILDFEYSGIFVNAVNSTNCQDNSTIRCLGGTYDVQASATFQQTRMCEAIPYNGDLLGACNFQGSNFTDGRLLSTQVTDYMQVGDALVVDVPFQLNLADGGFWYTGTSFTPNVLGLGYSVDEFVSTSYYSSLVEVLIESGIIESRVFSIGLSEPGELTFGGFNANWLNPSRAPVTLDFIPVNYTKNGTSTQIVHKPVVPIHNITITSHQLNQTFTTFNSQGGRQYAALIDYREPSWWVPPELYEALVSIYNSSGELSSDLTIPCTNNLTNTVIDVNIDFGNGFNKTITELLVPLFLSNGFQATGENGNPLCYFPVVGTNMSDRTPFLWMGTVVTSHLYSIFDLDNGQITITDAWVGDHSDYLIAVSKGPNAVQEALGGITNLTRPTQSARTNIASIAGPAVTETSVFMAVSEAPLSYNTNEDQGYLPLDARTSTLSSRTSTLTTTSTLTILSSSSASYPLLSSGTLSLETATSTGLVNPTANNSEALGRGNTSSSGSLVVPAMTIYCLLLISLLIIR